MPARRRNDEHEPGARLRTRLDPELASELACEPARDMETETFRLGVFASIRALAAVEDRFAASPSDAGAAVIDA